MRLKPLSINDIQHQRGIALIEALVSMLIIMLSVAASLYVVSRANNVKTEMSIQSIATEEMRSLLKDGNPCQANLKLHLPGTNITQPVITAIGCDAPNDTDAVTVDGVIVKNSSDVNMTGRVILTAKSDNQSLIAGDITVGGPVSVEAGGA